VAAGRTLAGFLRPVVAGVEPASKPAPTVSGSGEPSRKAGTRPRADRCPRCAPGFRYQFPSFDLLSRPYSWHIRVANALRYNWNAFGDDQTRAGSLRIVFDHELRRNVLWCTTQASKRGHDHSIWQMEVADLDGVQERNHQDKSFRKGVLFLWKFRRMEVGQPDFPCYMQSVQIGID